MTAPVPLTLPSINLAAGDYGALEYRIPERSITNLSEDATSYSLVNNPAWVSLVTNFYESTILITDSIQSVAERFSDVRNFWKSQYNYVRPVSDSRVASQLLDLRDDIVSKNPTFANVDLFGVAYSNKPFQAAYTRIVYTLYGTGNYTFQQHADIADEVGGTGFFTYNPDGTVKLDTRFTDGLSPFPSRFRNLGTGAVVREIPVEMQSAYDSYWSTWDNVDRSAIPIWEVPGVNFARGKLHRINSTQAVYRRPYAIALSWAPTPSVEPGNYTVTVRSTNDVTNEFTDYPWEFTITEFTGSGGGGGGIAVEEIVSSTNYLQRIAISLEKLTSASTSTGIRTIGPYDWLKATEVYSWYKQDLNLLRPSTATINTIVVDVNTITNNMPKFL
jgi:hypothetical protein